VTSVSPHIVVADAEAASAWYSRGFGAREINRVPLPGGKLMTVEVQIGDSLIHVGSEFPDFGILSPLSLGGTATVLQITTDDAEPLWRQALDAGAEARHPLAEQFWGELHGQLSDPFGHRWNIAQRIRNVPPAEVAAAAAEVFGQPAQRNDPNA
jgi:PhnB protein